jgi:hypothetical protein
LVVAACASLPLAQAASTPPASPQQDPRSVSLTAGDLPDGLTLCPVSGPIDSYLQHLQADGSSSYEVTAAQWAKLKRSGATAGWVQSYAQTPDDCAARLGERKGQSAISFAIRFRDATSASAGFAAGFLGLRPEQGMAVPGLTNGLQTQLTADSWTYDQTDQMPPVFVAFWANRQFDLFLLTERLPAGTAQHAAADMNDRVR